jgi:hypothetical protein
MGILPWSFGFLLIMTILSWALVGKMSEETLVTKSILTVVNNQATALTDALSLKSTSAYVAECENRGIKLDDDGDEEEEEEGETPKRKLQPGKKHRRSTSRLHVLALFSNDEPDQKTTQEYLFRNLVKTLYGSVPLCTPQGDNDPYVQQIFEEVRAKALEIGPKFPMRKAQYLANIELTGPRKTANQFSLFLILRGGQGEVFPGAPCKIHSLLDYISMNRRETCMSVYLAPAPILLALFGNVDLVTQICQRRQEICKKIRADQKEKTTLPPGTKEEDIIDILSDEFKTQFQSYLPSDVDPKFVEFRVSSTLPKDFPEKSRQK